ncbi:MAG: glycosyltransferase family 2 protein [Vicinamibacterales bacterium]
MASGDSGPVSSVRPVRVTCIIPFLNAERFIKDTIESVMAQTYAAWELLLIDDGSTDASSALAQSYAQAHPGKVRYIEHPGHGNRGVCASRNVGITEARGEFVAFLDADDIWQPLKLEQQVAIFDAFPMAAMVYGTPLRWHRWAGHGPDVPLDFTHQLGVAGDSLVAPSRLLVILLTENITPLPSDVLVRRSAAAEVGGFDEETFVGNFQFYEDQAFFAKMFLRYSVYAAPRCWTWYRQHEDSCVAVVLRAGWYHEKHAVFLHWLEQYLATLGSDDAAVTDALHRLLHPPRPSLRHRLAYRRKQLAEVVTSFRARRGRRGRGPA